MHKKRNHVVRRISPTAEETFKIKSSHFPNSCEVSISTLCLSSSASTNSSSNFLTRFICSSSVVPIPGNESINTSICLDFNNRSLASSLRSWLNCSAGADFTDGSVILVSFGNVGSKSCEVLIWLSEE